MLPHMEIDFDKVVCAFGNNEKVAIVGFTDEYNEYVVLEYDGNTEEWTTGYYTEDEDDAIGTAKDMIGLK